MGNGVNLFREGRYAEAIPRLEVEACKERTPGLATFFLRVSRGVVSRSENVIRAAIADAPEDLASSYTLGVGGAALFGAGYEEAGINMLRDALAEKPDYGLKIQLACCLRQRAEDRTEAAAIYDGILQEHPQSLDALTGQAFILQSWGQLPEAEQLLRRAVRAWPGDPDARELLAHVYVHRREYARAIREARRAIRRDFHGPAGLHGIIAYCYYQRGKAKKAKKHVDLALKIDPTDEYAMDVARWIEEDQLGLALFEEGLVAEAEPHLKRLAANEDPKALATLYLGAVVSRKLETTEPIDQAVAATKGSVPADLRLQLSGIVKCDIGIQTEGISELRKAVALNPSSFNKFMLASGLDDDDETVDEAGELYRQIPNDAPAYWEAMARLAGLLDDPAEGLLLACSACQGDPHNALCHFSYAAILEEQEDHKAAIEEYERSLALGLYDPSEAREGINACREKLSCQADQRPNE